MAKFKLLLAALGMAALTGFMVWWLGPDLAGDFQNRSAQFETARDLRVTEARCKSKLFVISFCDIKITGPGLPGGKREFDYLIIGMNSDETIGLLRSKTPGANGLPHLTTTTGMDYLTNRIISFAVFVGLLGAMVIGGLVALLRGGRTAA